ncbi:hypothetical protein [Paenibacillus sp. CF384]|uniref:hypothetical protein n=1 Tax=Paenibacillus sp. CF384 TaxID=1884382 RepID=UPI00089C5CD5|nr:hypothetical protein [Paenibacillus sp. CF384]SDW70185.1 hypothetical protein SAMN05518855_1004197 [Paenibacillus sp. CF384]
MPEQKQITADDLAKISSTLAIIGYGIGILALEKADSEKRSQQKMSAAIKQLMKRFG